MNKLLLATSAVVLACSINWANAQSYGSAPGAQGQEIKKENVAKDDANTSVKKHKMKKHKMKKQAKASTNSPDSGTAESAGDSPK